ncbi:ATP-binding protein [Streptomyces decoyicus]|uniref:ATP-binding protein n=1 Tax=Streptomyces decoyicus TaxID=249567 RepID=UPI00386502AD
MDGRALEQGQVYQAAGDLHVISHAGARPPAPVIVTRTLPRDVSSFTGRDAELRQLLDTAGTTGIRTIDGMPGVGKTVLAVRAAHLLAERFPDGQLMVSLESHTRGRSPADPADVLDTLLTGRGIAPQRIPPTLEGRSSMWRDQLAGKKVLLVLDDAADQDQIEPLLPGSGSCLVLVTSRRRMVALDGAEPLPLDVLPPGQAAQLFTRLARRGPDGAEADTVARIVQRCGYLPLAIVLLAGRLAHHPAWSVSRFAEDFTATRDRLAELASGSRATAAAFEMSYRNLHQDQQSLFRHLALHPGPDMDAYAVAALTGVHPVARAHREMDVLYTDHLVDEVGPGRYRLHDLIREYASTLAANDPTADRERAMERLLDYYQYAAATADHQLARRPRPALPAPAAIPDLTSRAQATAWMRTEHLNLFACADQAHAMGHPARVIRLAASMAITLRFKGPWLRALVLHEAAATAARQLGDRLGEAIVHNELGRIRRLTGNHRAATTHHERALRLYQELGNRLGETQALNNLGRLRRRTGDYVGATALHERALHIHQELSSELGEAHALNDLGRVHRLTGNYANAAKLHERALHIYRRLGNVYGDAHASNDLGRVRQLTADHDQAATLHEHALRLHRELDNQQGEAYALNDLGRVRRLAHDYATAASLHERALHIHQQLGNRQGEAEALNDLGATLAAKSARAREALALHEQAAQLARQIGSPLEEARALEGSAHCRSGTADGRNDALNDLGKAVEIYQRIGAAEAGPAADRLRALAVAHNENGTPM